MPGIDITKLLNQPRWSDPFRLILEEWLSDFEAQALLNEMRLSQDPLVSAEARALYERSLRPQTYCRAVLNGDADFIYDMNQDHLVERLTTSIPRIEDAAKQVFFNVSPLKLIAFLLDTDMRNVVLTYILKTGRLNNLYFHPWYRSFMHHEEENPRRREEGGSDLVKVTANPAGLSGLPQFDVLVSPSEVNPMPLLQNPDGILYYKNSQNTPYFFRAERQERKIEALIIPPWLLNSSSKTVLSDEQQAAKKTFDRMIAQLDQYDFNHAYRMDDETRQLFIDYFKTERDTKPITIVRQGIRYERDETPALLAILKDFTAEDFQKLSASLALSHSMALIKHATKDTYQQMTFDATDRKKLIAHLRTKKDHDSLAFKTQITRTILNATVKRHYQDTQVDCHRITSALRDAQTKNRDNFVNVYANRLKEVVWLIQFLCGKPYGNDPLLFKRSYLFNGKGTKIYDPLTRQFHEDFGSTRSEGFCITINGFNKRLVKRNELANFNLNLNSDIVYLLRDKWQHFMLGDTAQLTQPVYHHLVENHTYMLQFVRLQQKARAGHVESQYQLACRYGEKGVSMDTPNQAKGIYWYQRAAEQGHLASLLFLAWFYTEEGELTLSADYFAKFVQRGGYYELNETTKEKETSIPPFITAIKTLLFATTKTKPEHQLNSLLTQLSKKTLNHCLLDALLRFVSQSEPLCVERFVNLMVKAKSDMCHQKLYKALMLKIVTMDAENSPKWHVRFQQLRDECFLSQLPTLELTEVDRALLYRLWVYLVTYDSLSQRHRAPLPHRVWMKNMGHITYTIIGRYGQVNDLLDVSTYLIAMNRMLKIMGLQFTIKSDKVQLSHLTCLLSLYEGDFTTKPVDERLIMLKLLLGHEVTWHEIPSVVPNSLFTSSSHAAAVVVSENHTTSMSAQTSGQTRLNF